MLAKIKCVDFELGCHFSQTPCNKSILWEVTWYHASGYIYVPL